MIVGYVSGVFDLLHVGHARFLAACRDRCDRLLVGVLEDRWVEHYKRRPIIPVEQRAELVGALAVVDLAFPAGPTRTLGRPFYERHGITVQFVGVDNRDSAHFQLAREVIRLEVVESGSEVRTTAILQRLHERDEPGPER